MAGQPTPPVITEAFAKNAAPPYIQNPIPLTTVDPGRASFDLGFPPQTMTEIFAGGTPPFGQDVNGILNMITAHLAAAQAGQPYKFNSTVSTAMGGYAIGCVLGMADNTGLWVNQVNGNTTDPDGGSAAGWLPLYSNGYAAITGLTGGTRVLTPAEYRRGVIVLSGTLAGNLQVVLPNSLRSWLIVNTTSGSFTTTVKTAGGSGVVVSQGGFPAPVEVYGDGTNIYPTVAPTVIPGDVNPTPNTFAVRSNAGYLFATYFNQNSSIESFSMAAVYADAGDGYHRKIGLANFAAQIALSQFAGQVANAQVPQSAVTQHAAAVLASAALTGTPTAPTPSAGDNSTRVATTAFVQAVVTAISATPSQNGQITFPVTGGGFPIIIKWGYAVGPPGGGTFTFAYPQGAFPHNAFAGFMSTAFRNGSGSNCLNYVGQVGLGSMSVVADQAQFGAFAGFANCFWLAIGN